MIDVSADLDAAPTIRVLARLDDPKGLTELGELVQDGWLVRILSIMVQLLKLEELWIVEALLDVERERQVMMILFAYGLVVDLHVVEYGLLVAQVVVVLHLAVVEQAVRGWVLLLVVVFLLAFLASAAEDSAVLGSTAVGSCRVLLLELDLGAGVTKRC